MPWLGVGTSGGGKETELYKLCILVYSLVEIRILSNSNGFRLCHGMASAMVITIQAERAVVNVYTLPPEPKGHTISMTESVRPARFLPHV